MQTLNMLPPMLNIQEQELYYMTKLLSAEPWTVPLSAEMLNNVSGFISFLQRKQVDLCDKNVDIKLEQLMSWRNVAVKILSAPNCENFVDAFSLNYHTESFFILDTVYGNRIVKVIVVKEKEEPNFESKINDDDSTVLKGYILNKQLREVRTAHESRDIFTALRCDFDMKRNAVSKIYKDEKFIIKRIAKAINNELFNERLKREFKVQLLLGQLNHPGINKLAHYCEDERNIFAISYSAGDEDLLEYLQRKVQQTGSALSEDEVRSLFKTAIEGLMTSHHLGIAHRDISLENFVVHHNFLEVIDWGHSASSVNGKIRFEGIVGKARYFAPELLRDSKECQLYDPFKADVFSLGVCLYACFLGQMPVEDLNSDSGKTLRISATELLKKNNKILSPQAEDLLNLCLKWKPEERASMKEIFNHAFFKTHKN